MVCEESEWGGEKRGELTEGDIRRERVEGRGRVARRMVG